MPFADNPLLWGIAAWLLAGLWVQGVLVARQRALLARLRNAADVDGAAVDYGRRRALFDALDYGAALLRVGLWVGLAFVFASALTAVTSWAAGAGLFVLLVACDQCLQQAAAAARWWCLERRFGRSRMAPAAFVGRSAHTVALNSALAALAIGWIGWPFALWPAVMAWPASALLLVVGAGAWRWAEPNLVAPLFNRFSPLPAGELRTRLQAMTRRCGAALDDIRVMDNARYSRVANAYFTGLGRNKRVVLFDTLIDALSPAELEAVMAHELGHYCCGHLRRYYALTGALLFADYLMLAGLLSLAWPAAAPALVIAGIYLLLAPAAWPAKPWLAALKRRYEYEADAFAVRHAEPAALDSALTRLLAANLTAPRMDRAYAAFYATHPPGERRLQRIRRSVDAPAAG